MIKDDNRENNKDILKTNENEIIDENSSHDISNDVNEKISTKRKYFIIGFIIGILAVFLISMNILTHKYSQLVYPGITIYEQDLSKLNREELKNKLNDLSKEIDNKNIYIKSGKNTYNLSMKEVVSNYNLESKYNEIISTYKDESKIKQIFYIIFNKDKDYKFDVTVNEKYVDKFIKDVLSENNKRCIEPKVIIKNDKISYKDGVNGKSIDENDLLNKIETSIGIKDIVIDAKYNEEKPLISINDLKQVNSKISTYTTTYGAGGGRGKNVELAAKKIDDIILMPGDEFSYEKAMGDITLEAGFFYAPVISNGKLKDGVGGGVCQVSSTLYNTQLKAGILPTERRNHSKPVSYVPRGLDATLATGSIDYKFKNTYDYPIVINTKSENGKLTIEFWSNEKALKGITYEARGYARGNTANTYLYGYDKEGNKVYEKHIDTSVYR